MNRTPAIDHNTAAPPTMEDWQRILAHLTEWAESDDEVRAVALIGSRARSDRPVDRWSDLDVLLFVTRPERFVDHVDWLDGFPPVWVTLAHDAPIPGIRVRQVIFEGGLDVDFIPMEAGTLRSLLEISKIRDEFSKGFHPLVDKGGEFDGVTFPSPPQPAPFELSDNEYLWTVQDFLFQVVWSTKHLRRGELWLAKDDVDGYMKGALLRMIEWHAHATNAPVTTWAANDSGGRLLERWAARWILDDLPETFASYDRRDIGRALQASMKLFRKVATEIAVVVGLTYPDEAHDAVAAWADGHLEEDAVMMERPTLHGDGGTNEPSPGAVLLGPMGPVQVRRAGV